MKEKTFVNLRDFRAPNTYLLEEKLVGMLVATPYLISDVARIIKKEDFDDERTAKIWEYIRQCDTEGKPVEVYPVRQLDSQYFDDRIFSHCVESNLMDTMRAAAELREAATRRRQYALGIDIVRASVGTTPLAEAAEQMERFIEDSLKVYTDTEAKQVPEVINDLAEQITATQRDREAGKAIRIPTKLTQLDFVTYGGFAPGNLVILAARPSVGKTALALQMALASSECGIPTTFYSLEMTNTELASRIIASTEKLTQFDMAQGKIDWTLFEAASGKFAKHPLWLNDRAHSLEDLCAMVTSAHRQGHCDVAFIDYLGLIDFGSDRRSYYTQVTEATKRIKRLAKDNRIPIVLLCQLNRDSSRDARAPELHDLRDSGSIEQDADIVLMADRLAEKRDVTTLGHEALFDRYVIRLYVRKNRQGRAGDCFWLAPNGSYTHFDEVQNADEKAKEDLKGGSKERSIYATNYPTSSADTREEWEEDNFNNQ